MYRHIWVFHPSFAEDPANGIPKQKAECPFCAREFSRSDNMERHKKEKHLGRKTRKKAKY
ncbi:hypothetical protein HDV64DRAFT_256977 [Trichoderma sp. TUCIM 5745]